MPRKDTSVVAMDAVPWWICAGVAFALMQHQEAPGTAWEQGLRRRKAAAPSSDPRLLQDQALPWDVYEATPGAVLPARGMDLDEATPGAVLPVPCFIGLIVPCGNVTVPDAGIDISTPFGKYHARNAGVRADELQVYTVWFCIVLMVFWALKTFALPESRSRFTKYLGAIYSGKVEDEDSDEDDPQTPEQRVEERGQGSDAKSEDFVASGNIYRLLAVLHPGVVGVERWAEYVFKALVCAYLQLYIPVMLLRQVLLDWELDGVKCPLWFAANLWNFLASFAALGCLGTLFAARCSERIVIEARAILYILSHREPEGAVLTARDPKSAMPCCAVFANEHFWCWLSMIVNISTALLLQVTIFLKIATYKDQIDHIVIATVSLYFVSDLDEKIMSSEIQLRSRYSRAVGKLTEQQSYQPRWMMCIAALTIAVMRFAVPVGLLGIFAASWRNRATGHIIGSWP